MIASQINSARSNAIVRDVFPVSIRPPWYLARFVARFVAWYLAWLLAICTLPARAITIEMDDVASDRVERQRAYAEGSLPLAGTPDLGQLKVRLAAAGLKLGDEVFLRIFKAESELELWVRKAGQFTLFATYPICNWSGTIGPKVREGDKQNPEGFYTVGSRQLHRAGRWPRALNLGFPNSYDRALGRTGSYLLVHGGCSSVGCYAMTNAVMAEIFALAEESLRIGQQRIHIHVFPFRMSDTNIARHNSNPWSEFWRNLKEGYDAFEATHVPPRIGLCDKRYVVERAAPEEVGVQGPLASCGASRAAVVEPSAQSFAALPPQWPQQATYSIPDDPTMLDWAESRRLATRILRPMQSRSARGQSSLLSYLPPQNGSSPIQRREVIRFENGRLESLRAESQRLGFGVSRRAQAPICNPGLASCRRFLAISAEIEHRRARIRSEIAVARPRPPRS